MCGIGGYYGVEKNSGLPILEQMDGILAHRGPDAAGILQLSNCGLMHRRLSIIDPSASANQPMWSSCKRYAIVFNGEVYNFRELKKKLKGPFLTESDTEAVLQAYIEWGADCVMQLNGMFAFAIYDSLEDELIIFRDRAGIKPLYYCDTGKEFFFSSELKALTGIDGLKDILEIDYSSICAYLNLGYIPDPASIYSDIRKLPPASYMMINKKERKLVKYWNAKSYALYNTSINFKEAGKQLKSLLEQSVEFNMISDVPFGVFLSGGVDSSLVAAIASRKSEGKLNTFNVGFEETEKDESRYASKVSRLLGTEHYSHILRWKDAVELVEEGIDLYDEPFADSSFLPLMLISCAASGKVRMVLTGEGGDELFYGYGAYSWASKLTYPLSNKFYSGIRNLLPILGSRGQRVKSLLSFPDNEHHMSHLFSQEQYLFSLSEIKKLLRKPVNLEYVPYDTDFLTGGAGHKVDQQALFDLLYYLPGDLLTKVDRASMHYSLECRVPLLDHNIIEFALSLPLSMKHSGNQWKYILKQVLYEYLPEEYFKRPKQGFSVPLALWLKNDLKYLADEYLAEKSIGETGLFNYEIIADLRDRFYKKNQHYLYNRIWLIIVLQRWLKKQLV